MELMKVATVDGTLVLALEVKAVLNKDNNLNKILDEISSRLVEDLTRRPIFTQDSSGQVHRINVIGGDVEWGDGEVEELQEDESEQEGKEENKKSLAPTRDPKF